MANLLDFNSAHYWNLVKLSITDYIGCVKLKIETYILTFNSVNLTIP